MKNWNRKRVITVFVLLSSVIIIFSIAMGFKGFSSTPVMKTLADTVIINKPFKLPDGYTASSWWTEVSGQYAISSIQVVPTMREL